MPVNPSGVMHLVPGDRLDRYELVCPIANGGMAAVWLARLRAKHGFEKFFAVKTILPEYAANARFQDMLLDEARIAAGIDHTNVAHTFDLGEEHGVLYLVMECVDGDSLGKLSSAITNSGGAFPMNAAIRIMADVCAGLHAAHELRGRDGHELNVVHRDISPQNILVSRSGVVKVIDFGIARARDRIADETLTGAVKGKIQFMAPEQAMARPVDRRADVWAAGAVLYKLLSGRAPFDGLNKLETMQQMAAGMLPDPLPAEVPRAVALVVEKSLASDPAERFSTALAMREALEAAMIGTGLQASSDHVAALVTTYLGERMARRRHGVEDALHAADLRDADAGKKPGSLRPRRNSDIPTAVINMRREGAGMPLARTSAPPHQVARASAPPHQVARTTEHSERALPAWGTTVFPLRPRMTRRVATTALAAVGAALLLIATVRRERPVRADIAKTPVAVAVAAPEILAAAPISIEPPASAPLQAMTAEATSEAPSPASLRQPKTTIAKPSETAKAKARREKRVKAAKAVTVPTRSDPVTDYYGF